MREERVPGWRSVWRSKDVLVVEGGVNKVGLAQWAWECEVRGREARVAREEKEGREMGMRGREMGMRGREIKERGREGEDQR